MLPRDARASTRTIVLGVLLALYPLAQFLAAPVIGALSDRHGRKPMLLHLAGGEHRAATR